MNKLKVNIFSTSNSRYSSYRDPYFTLKALRTPNSLIKNLMAVGAVHLLPGSVNINRMNKFQRFP